MIESLAILLFVCGFYYVVFWLIRNDGAARIADQKGLLRMRPAVETAEAGPTAVRPPAAGTTAGRRRSGAR